MGEGVSQEKATKRDLEGKSAAPRSSAVRRCSGALLVVPSPHAMTAWFHGLKTLGHMPHSYSQGTPKKQDRRLRSSVAFFQSLGLHRAAAF